MRDFVRSWAAVSWLSRIGTGSAVLSGQVALSQLVRGLFHPTLAHGCTVLLWTAIFMYGRVLWRRTFDGANRTAQGPGS